MSDEDKDKQQKEGESTKSKVELEPGQYEALLDHIAELEAAAASPKRNQRNEEEITDLDTLAEEGRRSRSKVAEELEESANLDDMTNTQLVQYLINQINKQGGERLQRIETAVETMRVLREIDKAETKHDDFWKYEEKIRAIATENPSLSIEKAYKLARLETEDEKSRKKEGEEERRPATRAERLFKLPPRPQGEKPGVAAGSTKDSTQLKTTREAALKAWNDVVGEGKTTV